MINWKNLQQKQKELYQTEEEVENKISLYLKTEFNLEQDEDYLIWITEDYVEVQFLKRINKEQLQQTYNDLNFDSDLGKPGTGQTLTKFLDTENIKQTPPRQQLNNIMKICYLNMLETKKTITTIFTTFYDDINMLDTHIDSDKKTIEISVIADDMLKGDKFYEDLKQIGFKLNHKTTLEADEFTYTIEEKQ